MNEWMDDFVHISPNIASSIFYTTDRADLWPKAMFVDEEGTKEENDEG